MSEPAIETPLVPPLPDMRDMVAGSAWLGKHKGLREAAAFWLTKAPPQRHKLAGQARRLARPSLRWESLSAVARAGGRVLNVVGPDGLAEIFRATSDARRVREGKAPKRGTRAGHRPLSRSNAHASWSKPAVRPT